MARDRRSDAARRSALLVAKRLSARKGATLRDACCLAISRHPRRPAFSVSWLEADSQLTASTKMSKGSHIPTIIDPMCFGVE